MALKPKRAGDCAGKSRIEVGIFVHNDEILPAHLRNHTLDPDLPRSWPGGFFHNMQSDLLGTRERHKADSWGVPQAYCRSWRRCPSHKLTTPGGIPASCRMLMKKAPMAGVSDDGFSTTVLPVTSAAVVIPTRMAQGKFHGGMTAPTPSGIYRSSLSSPFKRVSGCGPA